MAELSFPGEILNVRSDGKTNGNDTIALTYDFEVEQGMDKDLVPFYAIGNGDYFCFSAAKGDQSPVLYLDHGTQAAVQEKASFAEWVKALPEFLNG